MKVRTIALNSWIDDQINSKLSGNEKLKSKKNKQIQGLINQNQVGYWVIVLCLLMNFESDETEKEQ